MASRRNRGPADVSRQFNIKLNVVKRLVRDVASYQEELESDRARIEAMQKEGRDEYDIRKQQEVLAETEAMIPDTQRRLQRAAEDLKAFMEENAEDAGVGESALRPEAEDLVTRHTGSAPDMPASAAAPAAQGEAASASVPAPEGEADG